MTVSDAAGSDIVGPIGLPAGDQHAHVRGDAVGATLEEIVLRYLESARAGQLAEAA
jgi:hypothetical protein